MSYSHAAQVLFERGPEAVLLLDRDGVVRDLNREALRLLGVERERIVERPVLGAVLPRDRERVKDLFLRVLGGQEREWINSFRRGDGVTRVQRIRAVPVQREGITQSIVIFTRDVTESRSGRPETIQLQTLLENLPGQLVVVLDTAGRVRYSSGLSRTHFRHDADTLGESYESLLEPGEENERLCAQMRAEVAEGRDWAGTHWHQRVDGKSFPVRVFASPYRDPHRGRIVGALLVGRDASVEHDWRERAQRAQHLAEVGEVVAGAAARLAEAVGRVGGALGHGVPGDEPLAALSVPAELARMRTLVASLEEFAQDVEPTLERVFLPIEVGRAVEELAPWLAERRVHVVLEPNELLGTAQADPRLLRRVVDILLRNAAEARGDAAGVRVDISFAATARTACVRIADDGEGVGGDALHRIFEPFFTTREGHAGLGLSLVRSIALAHGGSARAEAREDGSGTVVTVEIPFEAAGSTLRFRPVALELGRTRTVLVVDDEETVRLAIRRFLEKVGFEVREAWSGRSALAQITAGRPPELVLTDLNMLDGNGVWFLEQLSRDFPDLLRHTVIVTGNSARDEIGRLTRETGCPVLIKPLDLSQLLDVLDEVAVRS
jgi:PAS domain S-box-containing protein